MKTVVISFLLLLTLVPRQVYLIQEEDKIVMILSPSSDHFCIYHGPKVDKPIFCELFLCEEVSVLEIPYKEGNNVLIIRKNGQYYSTFYSGEVQSR